MWDNHRALGFIATCLNWLAVLALLFAGLFYLVHSPLFPVRKINIQGQMARVTPVQLRYIAENELSGTFFTVDIDQTRAAFGKLPWVREAQVRRRWPDQLDIMVLEHKALARWGENGLIGTDGQWFDAASDQSLPVLFGPQGSEGEMAKALARFTAALAPSGLKPLRLWMNERRAWRVELDNGVVLELGRGAVDERIHRFAQNWKTTLSVLPYQVDTVDLRYPNGYAVKMPDYKAPAAK
ncbi:cell division protein FtsQ/DivIB [Craterilacuibacter sp. RT1T]|uniref:cell division protein FtsQ/DivIB n=1 Tax=Craterilacuibacter sp. RT1T TaxID=2942211 RepID=UPI0020BD4BCD|nr:cell division protein FtsQ/DivIB [Craterilacuibacter sp. RT1T]MCL6264113.1 cell division protein FtsQ/DivIB [Craterilacuibacter sp. RT1T]